MSAFAKADAMKPLKGLFEELKITPSVYEELMRSKRAGYDFVNDIFQNVEIILLSEKVSTTGKAIRACQSPLSAAVLNCAISIHTQLI